MVSPSTVESAVNLVIIGASTGGTRILPIIFESLPVLNASIILVQHMPQFINASFLKTLGRYSRMPLKLAENSERIKSGVVYVVPGEIHCTLSHNRTLNLWHGEKVNYVCPSIDVTMQSVARPKGERLTGIILTGMGRDGANGLAHIKAIGGTTIAQDKQSSAIFGMPAEAIATGCVDHVFNPLEIASFLSRTLS